MIAALMVPSAVLTHLKAGVRAADGALEPVRPPQRDHRSALFLGAVVSIKRRLAKPFLELHHVASHHCPLL